MRIYIAGSITNDKDFIEHFGAAEEALRLAGHTPLNPAKPWGFEYKDYIDMGLNELMHCQGILMLDGWERSPGANLEKHYAEVTGMKIFYEGE